MNPFTAFIDWVEDYPAAGLISAFVAVALCTIAGIVWGQCDEYHIPNVLNVRIWICFCQPPNV